MDTTDSFAPRPKSTRQVATATASATLALPINDQVRLVAGGADCRIEFGKDVSVAVVKPAADGSSTGSVLLKAGSVEVFSVPANTQFVAFATDSGAGTLELTPGVGL